jgi:DNA polymerase
MGVETLPPLAGPVLVTPAEALATQQRDLAGCQRCALAGGRKTIVFGSGNPEADFMCIGEGPGADEDEQGLPFVGRAGQLLTKMLEAIRLARDEVYIANVVKCRPPGNRNPEGDEVAACMPFLRAQIATIRPKVILALGGVATQALLRTKDPIGRLRGRVHPFGDAVIVPTFHPAFLLRSPDAKKPAFEDLKLARREYDARRSP